MISTLPSPAHGPDSVLHPCASSGFSLPTEFHQAKKLGYFLSEFGMCNTGHPAIIVLPMIGGSNICIASRTAVMRPEWETAYLAATLCLNTTARGCELKGLQWADVDLFDRTLTIRKSKTAAGVRAIPLTEVACSVLARLRTRAESFGPVGPEHYVFAAYGTRMTFNDTAIVGSKMVAFDPTKHVDSWRTAFRKEERSLLRLSRSTTPIRIDLVCDPSVVATQVSRSSDRAPHRVSTSSPADIQTWLSCCRAKA
jgi:hypothetical protein